MDPSAPTPPPTAPTPDATTTTTPRGVTVKAVLAGLLGIAVIGLYSNTNDRVLGLSPLVGNFVPIGAFSLILALVLMWNPLVGWLRGSWRYSTRELAVVLSMMLLCSWIPGSGFYRYFHAQVLLPWVEAPAHLDWAQQGTLSYLPDGLYPLDPRATARTPEQQAAYDRVYAGFRPGLADAHGRLKVGDAPYGAWLAVMPYWWTLSLTLAIAVLALVWLAHRQWSHHEQLRYPIAAVATALIERSAGRATSDLFYSGLFWAAFIPVFALHGLNLLHAWFPASLPAIPFDTWWIGDLRSLFPSLTPTGQWIQGHLQLYFLVVGLAYFIPSEVGLSMGLCTGAVALTAVQWYFATGQALSGDDQNNSLAGAYLAYFAILVYTGRHYYARTVALALALRVAVEREREQAWAARLFLFAAAVFIGCLVLVFGMDWLIALLFTAGLLIYFLVFARIVAETGIPFFQAPFDVGWTLCTLIGLPAVGPAATVLMVHLGGVLNEDARECLPPYAANTLKIAENTGLRAGRVVALGIAAMAVALLLGFFAQTYSLYAHGAARDPWAAGDAGTESRAAVKLKLATRGLESLRESGQLDAAAATHGLAKLTLIPQNTGHARELGWMGFGAVGAALLALLRFRFSWWPLHPVLFLMWGTWTSSLVWLSFLIGWAIKEAIVRFGGGRTYQRLKPLFIGMAMGEIAMLTVSLLVGLGYYLATGMPPVAFRILPN